MYCVGILVTLNITSGNRVCCKFNWPQNCHYQQFIKVKKEPVCLMSELENSSLIHFLLNARLSWIAPFAFPSECPYMLWLAKRIWPIILIRPGGDVWRFRRQKFTMMFIAGNHPWHVSRTGGALRHSYHQQPHSVVWIFIRLIEYAYNALLFNPR